MNLQLIHTHGSGRLILIFAGWGMDPNPFRPLRADGYDIAVVWDCSDPSLSTDMLLNYREVVVVAWSMGVFAASRVLPSLHLPVTLAIAVNGTKTPVSDTAGIPVAIFESTLRSLSAESLARFNRRMCGSASAAGAFELVKPGRDIESLRTELRTIGEQAVNSAPSSFHWDIAVVGTRDMIFPAAAQRVAWADVDIIEVDEPHLPDFQRIIDRLLVKKDHVARSFESSRRGYDSDASFQHSVALHLVEKMAEITPERHFNTAIEIGAGAGRLTSAYCSLMSFDRLELWDIAPVDPDREPPVKGAVFVTDDAEVRLKAIESGSVDLVLSASTLQWFNSPANGVREIERVLRRGGIGALALYVAGTYDTFSREIGTSLRYTSSERLSEALKESAILYAEKRDDVVSFPTTADLLRHISRTGVSSGNPAPAGAVRRAMAQNTLRQLEYSTFYLIFKKI